MVDKIGMSARKYLNLPEPVLPTELINGEFFRRPSNYDDHQRMLADVSMSLANIISIAELRIGPLDVYLNHLNVSRTCFGSVQIAAAI